MTGETRETSGSRPETDLREIFRTGVRETSRIWWWYLIVGIAWVWYGTFVTQLLLGIAELVLGVWAVRSWERSLLTLTTLVGAWAIFVGVSEIFAAFSLREAGKSAERVIE
jgi:uncharacterized membrane protein HdeD (DUF308 family)